MSVTASSEERVCRVVRCNAKFPQRRHARVRSAPFTSLIQAMRGCARPPGPTRPARNPAVSVSMGACGSRVARPRNTVVACAARDTGSVICWPPRSMSRATNTPPGMCCRTWAGTFACRRSAPANAAAVMCPGRRFSEQISQGQVGSTSQNRTGLGYGCESHVKGTLAGGNNSAEKTAPADRTKAFF